MSKFAVTVPATVWVAGKLPTVTVPPMAGREPIVMELPIVTEEMLIGTVPEIVASARSLFEPGFISMARHVPSLPIP